MTSYVHIYMQLNMGEQMDTLRLSGPGQITCEPPGQWWVRLRYTRGPGGILEDAQCMVAAKSCHHYLGCTEFVATYCCLLKHDHGILKLEHDGNSHRQQPFPHGQSHVIFIWSQHYKILLTKINNKTYNHIRSGSAGVFCKSCTCFIFF